MLITKLLITAMVIAVLLAALLLLEDKTYLGWGMVCLFTGMGITLYRGMRS